MIATIALFAVTAAPAVAATRCRPAHSRTVVASSYARVFVLPSGAAYACVVRTGRRYRLARGGEVRLEGPGGGRAGPMLVGKRVAYVVAENAPALGYFRALYVLDIAAARKRRLYEGNDDLGWGPGPFRLFFDGVVGWSGRAQEAPGTFDTVGEVWRGTTAGASVLDRGRGVDPASFAVSDDGRRLFWMNGDEPRSAPVR